MQYRLVTGKQASLAELESLMLFAAVLGIELALFILASTKAIGG